MDEKISHYYELYELCHKYIEAYDDDDSKVILETAIDMRFFFVRN